MQVTAEEFKVIARFVDDLCGVVLDESKTYLIESRLSKVAEDAGCKTFTEMYCKARYEGNKILQAKIIDAITTHETLFFRDNSPFEALQHKVLPELFDAKARTPYPKRLRIWSAACSTGQEPYSMAIVLNELLPDVATWDIKITATDISDAAIQFASLGRFRDSEIQRGMKPQLLAKYFTQEPGFWKIRDHIRAMIAYKRLNLLEPFNGTGPFDIIFCRNVAIYFNGPARKNLFDRLTRELAPGGYLFVGSSESLSDLGPQYAPQHHCRAVFYQPNRQPAMASA
jgi:chemotaxis protein methyltransferase CheR